MSLAELNPILTALIAKHEPKLIEIRRTLHQHPELSREERWTSQYVGSILEGLGPPGLTLRRGIGGTGIIAELTQGKPGPIVAHRCDMDALPIQDEKRVPYASQNAGVLHACGHDVHMTVALGAAMVLREGKIPFAGTIRWIFQPAEEVIPGGALDMIEAGAVDDLQAILGLHVDPLLEVGKVGIRYGVMSASSDAFELEIRGKGGHGAKPHTTTDPVLISAQVINALHHLVGRKIDPRKPAVVTMASIHGGSASNLIPDSVHLQGTFRTFDREVRELLPRLIEQTVAGITQAHGARYRLTIHHGAPPVINDAGVTALVEEAAKALLGESQVVTIPEPYLGSEDFSWYLERVPGTFLRLGTRGSEATSHEVHTNLFDVDERCLSVGVLVMTGSILSVLGAVNRRV